MLGHADEQVLGLHLIRFAEVGALLEEKSLMKFSAWLRILFVFLL